MEDLARWLHVIQGGSSPPYLQVHEACMQLINYEDLHKET